MFNSNYFLCSFQIAKHADADVRVNIQIENARSAPHFFLFFSALPRRDQIGRVD